VTGTGNTGASTTLTLANTGVISSTYGTSLSIPTFSVNSKGLITSITNTTIPDASVTSSGLVNTTTQSFTGNKTISGTLGVTGATTITGTLTVSGNTYPNYIGINGQVLTVSGTTGTLVFSDIAIRQISEQYKPTTTAVSDGQISFTLMQTPSLNAKVLMFINGIRVDNDAYYWSGKNLTYVPSVNGSYTLLSTDRVQFDYFY
jgi:hypothetical protein